MNCLNISLVKGGAGTGAGAGSGVGSRPGATTLGLGEPGTGALKVEEPVSFGGTVPASVLGSLSLVEPADLDVTDLGAERRGGFFRQGAIAEEAELLDRLVD